jgi:transcriptional regulator with XRE-family HTH domain
VRRQIRTWMRPLNPNRAHARSIVVEFGRNVRARRLAAGLTQVDLARLSQMNERFIREIERAESNPSLETMAFVAAALNCTVAELLRGGASTTNE